MNPNDLCNMATDQLIAVYIDLSIREAEAIDRQEMGKVKTLYGQLQAICTVLRARGPEARRTLVPLLGHRNAQLRLNAAKELLAVVPDQARATLENIAAHGPDQQSGDAGMTLQLLDDGVFKPT
jgi:hypothetical protein